MQTFSLKKNSVRKGSARWLPFSVTPYVCIFSVLTYVGHSKKINTLGTSLLASPHKYCISLI